MLSHYLILLLNCASLPIKTAAAPYGRTGLLARDGPALIARAPVGPDGSQQPSNQGGSGTAGGSSRQRQKPPSDGIQLAPVKPYRYPETAGESSLAAAARQSVQVPATESGQRSSAKRPEIRLPINVDNGFYTIDAQFKSQGDKVFKLQLDSTSPWLWVYSTEMPEDEKKLLDATRGPGHSPVSLYDPKKLDTLINDHRETLKSFVSYTDDHHGVIVGITTQDQILLDGVPRRTKNLALGYATEYFREKYLKNRWFIGAIDGIMGLGPGIVRAGSRILSAYSHLKFDNLPLIQNLNKFGDVDSVYTIDIYETSKELPSAKASELVLGRCLCPSPRWEEPGDSLFPWQFKGVDDKDAVIDSGSAYIYYPYKGPAHEKLGDFYFSKGFKEGDDLENPMHPSRKYLEWYIKCNSAYKLGYFNLEINGKRVVINGEYITKLNRVHPESPWCLGPKQYWDYTAIAYGAPFYLTYTVCHDPVSRRWTWCDKVKGAVDEAITLKGVKTNPQASMLVAPQAGRPAVIAEGAAARTKPPVARHPALRAERHRDRGGGCCVISK